MKTCFFALVALISLGCGSVQAQEIYTFTPAGATGNTGPDQSMADAAYTGTTLDGTVTVNGGIQEWNVPVTALYRIEAFGGQGYGSFGGRGAHISGEFILTAGDTLRVLVGQMAGPYLNFPATTYNHQFGGGGGSFVMQIDPLNAADLSMDTPLVIAGGGGGNHGADFVATADGQAGNDGEAGANASSVGAGGTGGNGGLQASSADGGGGLFGNGTGDSGGQAYINGGLGGFQQGTGGFGAGGGTSSWNNYRGGGGGGYSGGGGGNNSGSCCPAGGGGGSYNAGANPQNLAGVNLGDGEVVITIITGSPNFTKAFSPNIIEPGESSTLTFTLDSSFNIDPVTDLAFTDNLPAGLVLGTPANAVNTCGGTLTADDGDTLVQLVSGSVAIGEVCTITVDVFAAAEGIYDNVSSTLDSSLGTGTSPAVATLYASEPLVFDKDFAPSVAAPGDVVSLSIVIDNSAGMLDATGVAFIDNLPTGMEIAVPADLVGSCGGTVTADEGSTSIELLDGVIPMGTDCTISVNVTTSTAGGYDNVTSTLTSNRPDVAAAMATLAVTIPPLFSKNFVTDVAMPGQAVALTFAIDNSMNPLDATGLLFTDTLPAGMVVATPANASSACGGSFTANEGAGAVSLSAGIATAGTSCSISVDVSAQLLGPYNNISGSLTSSLGNSGTASDSLTVAIPMSRTVTDTGDAGDGICDASCTLRDAVGASISGNTVDFSPALPAPVQIELTGPPISVDVALDIVATPGVRTVINRQTGAGRLLDVQSNGNLRIVGVDFLSGSDEPMALGASAMGGAIRTTSGSTLEIIDGVFIRNYALAAAAGTASVPGGLAAGGAIYADGDLLLRNCSFVQNAAVGGSGRSGGVSATTGGSASGGAIRANALLDIVNCTFYDNAAIGGAGGNGLDGTMGGAGGDGSDGGIAEGGAIGESASSDVYMAFTTLIGNEVVGGAAGVGGTGTPDGTDGLAGSDTGAAIHSEGATLLNSSVVADSVGSNACSGGSLGLRTDNLVDDVSCPGTESAGLVAAFVPISIGADSPHFQPLPNSVAVDTSPDCLDVLGIDAVEIDQLQATRPMTTGGVPACDFGAVELGPMLFKNGFEDFMPPP